MKHPEIRVNGKPGDQGTLGYQRPYVPRRTQGVLKFILIGEPCFQNFQSLEIIGDRYVSIYGGVLSLSVKFSEILNQKYQVC